MYRRGQEYLGSGIYLDPTTLSGNPHEIHDPQKLAGVVYGFKGDGLISNAWNKCLNICGGERGLKHLVNVGELAYHKLVSINIDVQYARRRRSEEVVRFIAYVTLQGGFVQTQEDAGLRTSMHVESMHSECQQCLQSKLTSGLESQFFQKPSSLQRKSSSPYLVSNLGMHSRKML